ncbi:MAG: biotin/lipoyl-binding protein, partial [Pseudomonadales bacterium]|nr:biotin/lipoyl-binding protein [Pseudomonadales bacterium]
QEVVFEPLNEYISEGATRGRKRASEPGHVTAAMPGNIVEVLVAEGDEVKAGQAVLIAEAMKMETEIHASIAGVVKAVYVSKGDRVTPGEVLVEVS